jgi:hypothetical protein
MVALAVPAAPTATVAPRFVRAAVRVCSAARKHHPLKAARIWSTLCVYQTPRRVAPGRRQSSAAETHTHAGFATGLLRDSDANSPVCATNTPTLPTSHLATLYHIYYRYSQLRLLIKIQKHYGTTVHLCLPGIWVGFFGSLERLRGGNRPNTWRWVGIRARLGAQLAP